MKKPILLADGIFVDILLYYGAGNKSILFGFYYFAYCHQEDSILTCLIYRANIIPQDFTMETSYFLLLIKKSGHIDWF